MKIDPLLFKRAVVKAAPVEQKPETPAPTPAPEPAQPATAAPKVFKSSIGRLVTPTKPTVGKVVLAEKNPQQVEKPKAVSRVDMMMDITAPGSVEQGPLNFQERLNELDRLVNSQMGISMATVDTIRGHVMQIMIDLKQQPDLDSCLIDRDVHNVLAYIRHTHINARQELETATKKKEVKATKKSRVKFGVDLLEGPDSMFDSPSSLEQLGDMEI